MKRNRKVFAFLKKLKKFVFSSFKFEYSDKTKEVEKFWEIKKKGQEFSDFKRERSLKKEDGMEFLIIEKKNYEKRKVLDYQKKKKTDFSYLKIFEYLMCFREFGVLKDWLIHHNKLKDGTFTRKIKSRFFYLFFFRFAKIWISGEFPAKFRRRF